MNTDVLVGVLTLVGIFLAYLLGRRRARFERLYEQRALVIADLSRKLGRVERTAMLAADLAQPLGEVRLQRIEENKVAVGDFIDYFIGHTIWLDENLALGIDGYVTELYRAMTEYEADLAGGQPSSEAGLAAAARIEAMVTDVKKDLDARYREILYPPPWWDGPLRFLAWVQRGAQG